MTDIYTDIQTLKAAQKVLERLHADYKGTSYGKTNIFTGKITINTVTDFTGPACDALADAIYTLEDIAPDHDCYAAEIAETRRDLRAEERI